MVFRVTRPEVVQNLINFKDNLSEMRENKEQNQEDEEGEHADHKNRKYKVLLNRKTGDMRFAKKISEIEDQIAQSESKDEAFEDFKEVQIIVKDSGQGKTEFQVFDRHEQELKPNELDPLALKVTKETIDCLNQKSRLEHPNRLPGKGFPEEKLLNDLSQIQVELENDQIQNQSGWKGSIARTVAEQMLEKDVIGTYLLRNADEITEQTVFHLQEENKELIQAYLLTVVEDEEKIVDHLLLQTDLGWTLYHDDPNLRDLELYKYFPTPKTLIFQIQFAKHPKA